MSKSPGTADQGIDGPTTFHRGRLRADAESAGRARGEFSLWLHDRFAFSATGCSDIVLAVNEALANAAEHAYATAPGAGSVDVDACYDADHQFLRVIVEDRGLWRRPRPAGALPATRGRGIPLMRALADDTTIDTTSEGTRVSMSWGQLHLLQT